MQIQFTEHNQPALRNYNTVAEVEARILFLMADRHDPWFFQHDELATLRCWLYNRHRGPNSIELTKEAFID